MPFNPSPTGYFTGIQNTASGDAVTTSGVFIPYINLESYNTTTSGDIRQLVYSFLEKVSDTYFSLATADRPSQLTINKSAVIPNDNTIRNTYTISINLAYSGLQVSAE